MPGDITIRQKKCLFREVINLCAKYDPELEEWLYIDGAAEQFWDDIHSMEVRCIGFRGYDNVTPPPKLNHVFESR